MSDKKQTRRPKMVDSISHKEYLKSLDPVLNQDIIFAEYDRLMNKKLAGLEEANDKSTHNAFMKVKMTLELMELKGEKITLTAVAKNSGVSRSYLYKNTTVKAYIETRQSEQEKKNNSEYPINPFSDEMNNDMVTFALHRKLIESYILQYQLLTAQNEELRQKIEDTKKQIAEKKSGK